MSMQYPAVFLPDPSGGYVITFPDIPEAITQGDTEAEALSMAEDALITAMDFYFEDQRAVPAPSRPQAGERLIALPAELADRVRLLNDAVGRQGIGVIQA
jgi:antitoxin HicB